MSREQWKEFPDNPTIHVSNTGKVKVVEVLRKNHRSVMRGVYHPVMQTESGRLYIDVERNKKKNSYFVDVLVAKTWIENKEPENNSIIHVDGDYKNNSVDNLKWVSMQEAGASTRSRVVVQLNEDGNVLREFSSAREASRETGINQSSITRACSGDRKTAGKFYWRYK